jgi:uncharacterized protein (DUF1778 family)
MKKHAGRPKLGTQLAKGVFINARFTAAEAKHIRDAVAKSGMSQTDFVRKSLLNSADMVNV